MQKTQNRQSFWIATYRVLVVYVCDMCICVCVCGICEEMCVYVVFMYGVCV